MSVRRRSAFALVVLVFLLACLVGVYVYDLNRRSGWALAIAYQLSCERRPPTIEELRHRFGRAIRQTSCTPDGCEYEIFLSNRHLAILRVRPYSVLRIAFWAENGTVAFNSIEFWTYTPEGNMALAYTGIKYCDSCDSVLAVPSEQSADIGSTGSLEVGSTATAEMKRLAFALNTRCLAGLRGCTNIAEMYPDIWQKTSAKTIRCRVSNQY
jgi:hypothetical protein